MRKIIFRGQRVDTKEWMYGYYVYDEEWAKAYIVNASGHNGLTPCNKRYEVIPETIGQFTGLKDKNGVKIFEGDILQVNNVPERPLSVEWVDGEAGFMLKPELGAIFTGLFAETFYSVIGNIHQNPELVLP